MTLRGFAVVAGVAAVAVVGAWAAGVAAQAKPVVVVMETEKGTIEIEVDVARAPATSANFLRYVDAGLYNGGEFHRTVRPDTEPNKAQPIQVVQARRARGRPGYPPIALERTGATGLKHVNGTVSMARAGVDTATNEFFICIGDQPELDFGGKRNPDGQGFAAFGRVVAGMDVVRAIQAAPVAPARPARGSTEPPPLPNSQTLAPPIKILGMKRK